MKRKIRMTFNHFKFAVSIDARYISFVHFFFLSSVGFVRSSLFCGILLVFYFSRCAFGQCQNVTAKESNKKQSLLESIAERKKRADTRELIEFLGDERSKSAKDNGQY